jgi:hypothetical protein
MILEISNPFNSKKWPLINRSVPEQALEFMVYACRKYGKKGRREPKALNDAF